MASFKPFVSVNKSADRLAVAGMVAPRLVPGLPGGGGVFLTRTDISGNAVASTPVPVATMPSVKIVQRTGGGVSLLIRLNSNYAATLDAAGIERIAARMTEQCRNMSHGPLSLRILARLHHPYGRDKGGIGRRVPGVGRRVRGVRGSVPNLSVINAQSGRLARSWDYKITPDDQGLTIDIFNTAPEAWFVTAGTIRMQAHSPVAFVLQLFRAAMLSEWRSEATRAYHADKARAQLTTTLRLAA